MRTMSRRGGQDEGSMAVELVILAPLVLIFLYFLADIGRLAEARGQVQAAARDAVRAASVQRTTAAADTAASAAAQSDLAGLCPGAVPAPAGGDTFAPGSLVTYQVSCTVKVVPLLGHFLETTMTATATAPLETFRRSG